MEVLLGAGILLVGIFIGYALSQASNVEDV